MVVVLSIGVDKRLREGVGCAVLSEWCYLEEGDERQRKRNYGEEEEKEKGCLEG